MKKSVSLLVVLCMLFSLCGTIFVNAAPPADKTVSTEVAAIDTQDNELLIELDITDSIRQTLENKRECAVYIDYLHRFYDKDDYAELVSLDDEQSAVRMRDIASNKLQDKSLKNAKQAVEQKRNEIDKLSAWRIDMTLREFPKPKPLNLWFDYPIHRVDRDGILIDAESDDTRPGQNYRKNFSKKQSPEQKAESRRQDFETHYYSLKSFNENGVVSLKELSKQLCKGESTIRRWVEDDFSDRFRIVKGTIEEFSKSIK